MGTMADRARIIYLVLLILFLLTIGFFILDYYALIDGDEIFPALAKKPTPVNWDKESPTEVEKLEIKKAREKLDEDIEEIERVRKSLEEEKQKLESEKETVNGIRDGIRKKEQEMKLLEEEKEQREKKIKVLADKIANMKPEKAIDILENWPDQDIIDVFKQMDKDAEEEGRATITNYLLTKFDKKRGATISNKWLDHNADRVPQENSILLED